MPNKDLLDKQNSSGVDLLEGKQLAQATPGANDLLAGSSSASNVNNFLSATPLDRLTSLSIGGLTPAVGGAKQSEDSLPLIGGFLGGAVGGSFGHPNIGLGLGTAGGDIIKQSIEKLKGEGDDIDVPDALALGSAAAISGKAFETLLKAGGVTMKLVPERARAKLFDKALQAVNLGKKQLSRNWNSSVNALTEKYPNTRINLEPTMKRLMQQIDSLKLEGDDALIPQLKSAVNKSPRLSAAVDDPSKAIGLTLKEAQELKNAVTSTTNAITRRAIKGKTTPNERVVFEIIDEFDDAITSGFKEMISVRAAYREGIKQFELARPLVNPGVAVENSILSKPQGLFGLGGTQLFGSTQGRLAAKDIMSQTNAGAKLFETLKSAHNINRLSDAVNRLGQIALGGGLLKSLGGDR